MTPGDGVIVTVGNTARGTTVEQHLASHLQVASRHRVSWSSPSAKRRVVCVLALSQIVTSQKKEGERGTRVQSAAVPVYHGVHCTVHCPDSGVSGAKCHG